MRDKPTGKTVNTSQSRGHGARLSVRLDPQVQELLKAVAEAEGLTPSAYVREAIERRLGVSRKRAGDKLPPLSRLTAEDRTALQRFTAEANKVGVNVNQIARKLNSGGQAPQAPTAVRVGPRLSTLEDAQVLKELARFTSALEGLTRVLDDKLGGEQ